MTGPNDPANPATPTDPATSATPNVPDDTHESPEPTTTALPLLAHPSDYRPNTIDMVADPRSREYWLSVFEHQLPQIKRQAAASDGDTADARSRADTFARRLAAILDDCRRDPFSYGRLSILLLCGLRNGLLKEHGFADPYRSIKQEENGAALALLPDLLKDLDAMPAPQRLLTIIRGIFAGNIFDLGSANTAELYASSGIDFHHTRATLPDRPWRVDDFDRLADRFEGPAHRQAVLFVDNAGADVTLGMIPLARFLLQRGTGVVLTANDSPAWNDITLDELTELIDRVAAFDPVIRDARHTGQLRLIGSGNGLPVIDLSRVAPPLAEAARDADLLVIEGMGRALETNYHARFTCDTLKIAMVKEQNVAELVGGELYDLVCRFEPAERIA